MEQPLRITYFGRLFAVLAVISVACFAIAAVIDVSSPSDRFEPSRDMRSVADGVLAAMDRSADPCDNFYEYACGSWLRSNRIPPDRTRYTKSFSVVGDMLQLMVKELLEGELQSDGGGLPSKPGLFYASCIDQMGIGGLNTLYLSPFRDHFNDLDDAPAFTRLLAQLHAVSSVALFDVGVNVDEKIPSQYALYFGQGGLGLPHRDNYFSMQDADVETREKYLKLIQNLLATAGKARLLPRQGHDMLARQVLDLETTLANATVPPEELRDPDKSYNKIKIDAMSDALAIPEYLKILGVDPNSINGSLVLDNPLFFDKIVAIMAGLSVDVDKRRVLRGYLAFHLVRSAADSGLLGESMYHEGFRFKQHIYGMKQLPEQWKKCQSLSNAYLGEAVGAAFVKKHFPETRKQMAEKLASEISKSFAGTLASQEWMDEATRQAAIEKLSAINWKVGYSSKLDTYDDLSISRASFQGNVAAAKAYLLRKALKRLGQPIDRTEWFMKPQEVNAYYSPTRNEMVFPAGILQQPFFSDAYPDAMNYGGIGAIVGHEMSHGFDDEGRKYDKNGLLTSWWSDASVAHYEDKAKCYIDLFNTYKPRDVSIFVKGNLTLGENLADKNGVNVAYRAFKSTGNNSQDGIPPPNPTLARELTNDQLFFVAYAQIWCTLYRREALKVQMMTNPHSPGQFRVQGPLSQSPAFAKAFACRNASRYNPTKKCSLWQ
ncbi:unnamed protein product [Chondrus crispus]|uniref:Uncharacterized protein n=1 Tax=Chondrus crispus TaxID=2769 RepID=R7QDD0_CHOCR|nr:unnamed protein product [Chondrus crispus]CDF35793.1 unnamed protein product [Chondrus crispus]|eukprot:XP_005715612.1 unnamed protein product [Chondrus crispus]